MKALPYKCTGDVSLTFLILLRFLETELMANLPTGDFTTEKVNYFKCVTMMMKLVVTGPVH